MVVVVVLVVVVIVVVVQAGEMRMAVGVNEGETHS